MKIKGSCPEKKESSASPTANLVTIALFVALIAVMAQVAVPLPYSPVPFTGQVIGVLLAAFLLGRRGGALTVAAYLLLGAAGAPVFSMARGGLFMLAGPTGGYLWGFLPAVFAAGVIIEGAKKASTVRPLAALLTALAIIYCCGALQLALIMGYSMKQALLIGVLPFLLPDLLKVFIAGLLGKKIGASLRKNGLGHLVIQPGHVPSGNPGAGKDS